MRSPIAATAAVFLSLIATMASAEIEIHDAYARASTPAAGAAFMTIHNHGGAPDRLVGAASNAAARVELHTHLEEDGVMRMVHVAEGFELPTDGEVAMKRGGAHVMLMGLVSPLSTGDSITVTLTFEVAGDVVIEIPVDNERMADAAHSH